MPLSGTTGPASQDRPESPNNPQSDRDALRLPEDPYQRLLSSPTSTQTIVDIREEIRNGTYNADHLTRVISAMDKHLGGDFTKFGPGDTFLQLLLEQPNYQFESNALPVGAWGALSTPIRYTLRLLRELAPQPGEVLLDAGCGGGSFCLAAAICSPLHVVGVDIQPHLIETAKRSTETINCKNVLFKEGDILQLDLSQVQYVYAFTPFDDGRLLFRFVSKLREELERNPALKICSLHRLTWVLEQHGWLKKLNQASTSSGIAIFGSAT